MSRPAARRALVALFATAAACTGGTAHAQLAETTLVPATIPDGFDRGRNVSVTERQRPDYDPLGIRLGGFMAFPRIDVGGGVTTNATLSTTDAKSAPIVYANPAVLIRSDWSRHQLQINASGQIRRFTNVSSRDEDSYNLAVLWRADLGSAFALTGEAQFTGQYETPFSGEANAEFIGLSRYTRDFQSLRGQYQAGQVRAMVALDRTGFDFSDIRLPGGTVQSQRIRDRDINRITGQLEYAFSPSVSLYSQLVYSDINYDVLLAPGVANRDSTGWRAIAGISFDIAGFARGVFGAGYTRRDFQNPIFSDVSGLSAEGRIEYFPSELTSFTLGLRRVIEDSQIGATNAFFDNRISLRVDHELLVNLLLNAQAEYSKQDYIDAPLNSDVYSISGGARYFASRTLGLNATVGYTKRGNDGVTAASGFDEFRALIGVSLRR